MAKSKWEKTLSSIRRLVYCKYTLQLLLASVCKTVSFHPHALLVQHASSNSMDAMIKEFLHTKFGLRLLKVALKYTVIHIVLTSAEEQPTTRSFIGRAKGYVRHNAFVITLPSSIYIQNQNVPFHPSYSKWTWQLCTLLPSIVADA